MVFLFITFFAFSEQAQAAVLHIKPAQVEVTAGNIVRVQVSVDTQGKVINNAESVVQFPTDLLEVVSLDSASSIFSLWVENPSFSNTTGQVTFNGGVPNPGFQGSSGNIVSIVFRAKKTGTASILFLSSAVRENDGLGTNILTETSPATITIRGAQVAPPPPTVDDDFVITSRSHPNQSAWYDNSDVQVSWTLPSNVTAVRTLLSVSSSAQPTIFYDSPITNRTIQDVQDGIWYFHAQYLIGGTWSKTQTYKIQIDTADPTDLSARSEKNELGNVTLFMSASDSLSGIDRFTVTVDAEKPIIVKSGVNGEASFDIPFTRVGEHTLTITAFDKAGNTADMQMTVVVDSIPELRINSYPTTIKVNESIEISGTAPYSFADLRVSVQGGDSVVNEFKLKSNSYSTFNFISEPILVDGTYTLWVDMLGDNGKVLLTSQRIDVSVKTPLLLRIGSYTIGLMKVLIPAIVLLILFLLITLYGWLKLFGLYRRVRKESREAEEVSSKAFKVLRTGVDRHIILLKKKKNKLTEEEMEFLEEFSEKLEEAERLVTKEIKDVTDL